MAQNLLRLLVFHFYATAFGSALSFHGGPRGDHSRLGRRRFLLHSPLIASSAFLPVPLAGAIDEETHLTGNRRSFVSNANTELIIPYSTQRRYKKITLKGNSLPVLLVSDKAALQCQAAMTIEAGQFCDTIPGIAHLMEHMVLSYEQEAGSSNTKRKQDFEDWLSEREGASNAFTANQKVCFHFTCPKAPFGEALKRFSNLFRQHNVESACRNPAILKREVRRVDSELNFDSLYSQEEHLTKAFVNVEHPYSVFSKGSLESLETTPASNNVDVGEELVRFFRRFYLPERATLVLMGQQSIEVLERYAELFDGVLSLAKQSDGAKDYFPGRFLQISRELKQVLIYRRNNEEVPAQSERLSLQWVLDLDYRDPDKLITASEVAFVVCQVLARRGPGSLYQYLRNRQWVSDGAIPKVTVPVDVSGFQILKLELTLTQDGFVNRSRVAMAVYESINTLQRGGSFVIPRELMAQYASIAKMFGYSLAPRPPDAIELSFDALVYGIDTVGSGRWYRFPEDRNILALNPIRRSVKDVLTHMSDPENALIIVSASDSSLNMIGASFASLQWRREPISGGAFRFDERYSFWFGQDIPFIPKLMNKDEFSPPVFNGLVPRRSILPVRKDDHEAQIRSSTISPGWTVWTIGRQQGGIVLPKQPPEPSCGRSAFVFQFLSPQPARASTRQAAYGELWKLCLEAGLAEIGELGAPGGLAYDVSYNQFGIRFSFLGVSSTLSSYIRRMMRGVAVFNTQHPVLAPSIRSQAIRSARKARGLSPIRRRIIISNLRACSMQQVEDEGNRLLKSITGVISFSQGAFDLEETEAVTIEVKKILQSTIPEIDTTLQPSAIPLLPDLTYKPTWKPRFASGCFVAGVPFVADACGRVKR